MDRDRFRQDSDSDVAISEASSHTLQSVPADPGRPGPGVSAVAVLWENRRAIGRFTRVAFLAFTVLAFLLPSKYQATTRLMPPDQNMTGLAAVSAMLSANGGGLGMIGADMLGMKNSGELFTAMFQSRTLQDRMIERFRLKEAYGSVYMQSARAALAAHTAIGQDRKSGLIALTVTDSQPQRAAALANGYVDELDKLLAEVSTSAARRERRFLEARLQAIKLDLDEAARQFSEFASKNSAIDVPAQGKAMVESAALLQGQLIAAQSEVQGLRQIYTGNNVRVKQAEARIGELQKQLNRMSGAGADSEGSPGGAAPLYPSMKQLPLLGVRYMDLYRRSKIEEAVYETLTRQYELAKVQEAREIPSVRILDAAVVPEHKASPSRLMVMLLGTAFSFFAASVWALGRNAWNNVDPLDSRKLLVGHVAHEARRDLRGLLTRGLRTVSNERQLTQFFKR